MKELKKLYNAILNDYSIQRYTLGWKDIINTLDNRFKSPIKKTDESFENILLEDAIHVSKGKLREQLISFSRELNINIKTIHEKTNRGTQRSPFGIGS